MRLYSRYVEHKTPSNNKASNILQKQFGLENFAITIIVIDNNTSLMVILTLEQYYIIKLNSTLNHLPSTRSIKQWYT